MPESENQLRELTAGQLGIWQAQQLDPDSPIYNLSEYLEICGDLDVDLFCAAIRHAVGEADSFHLRFSGDGESIRQFVDKSGEWSIQVIDVSSGPDPRSAAEEWMRADTGRPVDLGRYPLFEHVIFRVADDCNFWYQRYHHIIFDGFSTQIFVSRVAEIYAALLVGAPFGEGMLAPFSALLDSEEAYRASDRFTADRDFWRGVFAGRPEAVGLSGRPRALFPRFLYRHMDVLGPAGSAELKAAARRLRTSLSGLMIAAAAAYVHRVTGADDVVVGVSVPGRAGSAERGVPGMMANVVPVCLPARPSLSLGELVREVSAAVRGAVRHRNTGTRTFSVIAGALAGRICSPSWST